MGSERMSRVLNHSPTFHWTFLDTVGAQIAYELEVGTDNNWTVAENWATVIIAGELPERDTLRSKLSLYCFAASSTSLTAITMLCILLNMDPPFVPKLSSSHADRREPFVSQYVCGPHDGLQLHRDRAVIRQAT